MLRVVSDLKEWMARPKRSDNSLVARFFWADWELRRVQLEMKKCTDNQRSQSLIAKLHIWHEQVLYLLFNILDVVGGGERANRDYRIKFPDDITRNNYLGLVWFTAHCLSIGSWIPEREEQSDIIRPMARVFISKIDQVRDNLREVCLANPELKVHELSKEIIDDLLTFDRIFASFEFDYVSNAVKIRSPEEFVQLQLFATILFDGLEWGIENGWIREEQVEDVDPLLMFAMPRLSILLLLKQTKDCALWELISETDEKDDDSASDFCILFRKYLKPLYLLKTILESLAEEQIKFLAHLLASDEDQPIPNSEDKFSIEGFWEGTETSQSFNWAPNIAMHRLFLLISSLSDKLHSHAAAELRILLRTAFNLRLNKSCEPEGFGLSDDAGRRNKLAMEGLTVVGRTLLCLSAASPEYVNDGQGWEALVSWQPDFTSDQCFHCRQEFGFFTRRHHCRSCGQLICAGCTHSERLELPFIARPVRICKECVPKVKSDLARGVGGGHHRSSRTDESDS